MSANGTAQRRNVAAIAAVVALTLAPTALEAQSRDVSIPSTVRVTDPRLAAALRQLVAVSPSAARVVRELATSGLEVTIGTPAQLTVLPDSEGGPAAEERAALLSDPSTAPTPDEPPIAWVVFRVSAPPAAAPTGAVGTVDRAWVAVEADSVEDWIKGVTDGGAVDLIKDDYLAILAHEFVAHVGSIARTRNLADFCDDPPPGEAMDSDAQSCSLGVENRVRREINQGLGLEGKDKLPQRRNYSLEAMNFAWAHAMRASWRPGGR